MFNVLFISITSFSRIFCILRLMACWLFHQPPPHMEHSLIGETEYVSGCFHYYTDTAPLD